jgi:TolB-like protein/class 3 adenylate cyclase/Flp pilus assembly protein TadD
LQSGDTIKTADLRPEIAHLLLLDLVGYSKLLVNEQVEYLDELNRIVRETARFRMAEQRGRLVRLPTGDGMILIFYENPEDPVQCALEISQALRGSPHIQLRIGIHSGPINLIKDVNDRENAAGPGINMAQRVMDCGDAGHILLSKHVADDLAQYRHWGPYLVDLGECEVKHGMRIHVFNLCKEGLGNSNIPIKFRDRDRLIRKRDDPYPISRTAGVLLIAAALGVISIVLWTQHRRTPVSANDTGGRISVPEKSIAVLPFENLSSQKENEYFADGVQDEILTDLANVADLKVISRTSVMQYRSNIRRNLPDIARALGVSYILEGSVQRANERVRVHAQLVNARSDAHVWAHTYERGTSDVFAIQSEIAEEIVAQLKAKLSPDEKASIERKPTNDLQAYDLYAQAKVLLASTVFSSRQKEELLESVRLLDQAVARDPKFQLAFAQLARAHDKLFILGIDPTPERMALAATAVDATENLGPDSGEAHLAKANHLYCAYLDYDRARAQLALAARLLPNEPLVYELSGFIDRRQGRWDQSIAGLARACELDPQNIYLLQQLAITYQYLRRFDEMAKVLDHALELSPRDPTTRIARAEVELAWRANTKALHDAVAQTLAHEPGSASAIAEDWLYLALCEHDAEGSEQALAAMPQDGCYNQDIKFPYTWCVGIVARSQRDPTRAQKAFLSAREEIQKSLIAEPDFPAAISILGLIDAALGRKEEAIREGQRAVELLPTNKDAVTGALLRTHLVLIYAWVGQQDSALEELRLVANAPGPVSYGDLSLHSYWDSLRGDPRFERIVASLAPK